MSTPRKSEKARSTTSTRKSASERIKSATLIGKDANEALELRGESEISGQSEPIKGPLKNSKSAQKRVKTGRPPATEKERERVTVYFTKEFLARLEKHVANIRADKKLKGETPPDRSLVIENIVMKHID